MRYQIAIVVAALSLTGCDPEKVASNHFKAAGLNRLAALRDDLQPGALIVGGKSGAIYADNMTDYVTSATSDEFKMQVLNRTSDFNAVIKKLSNEKSFEPKAAVGFLSSLLPVDANASLKFTSKVRIDQIEARSTRMKIPDIERFLRHEESEPFRVTVRAYMEVKRDCYLVYEVWRANRFKMTTESGKEVSAGLKLGEVRPFVSKGEASFAYKRTNDNGIEIAGDKTYAFAVRVAKLLPGTNATSVKLDPTDFKVSGDIKGVSDDEYSALISPSGVPVKLGTSSEAIRFSK